MSEQKPISHADLARYWGCSPGNITNLVKRKGMPGFTSLRAADEWRAVNAPARKPRQTPASPPESSLKNPVDVGEKNARVSKSTTETAKPTGAPPPATAGGAPNGANESGQLGLPEVEGGADRAGLDDNPRSRLGVPPTPPPERIDITKFIDGGADFVGLMIRQAKEVPQVAYGLLMLKAAAGEPGAIAAASKNWHEAAGHAADVLERFVAVQKEAGELLSLDEVADVVVTELEEIRKGLKKLGGRAAADANPADPERAQRAIDAAVDELVAAFNNVAERARLELADRAADVEPELARAPLAAPAA